MDKTATKNRAVLSSRGSLDIFWGVAGVSNLYSFIYCLMASSVLTGMPLLGGAFYLFGELVIFQIKMRLPPRDIFVSRTQKIIGTIFGIFGFLFMGLGIAIYPAALSDRAVWVLSALAFVLAVRPVITRNWMENDILCGVKAFTSWRKAIVAHLLFLVSVLFLLFSTQETDTAWYLSGGFLLSAPVELSVLWDERHRTKFSGTGDSLLLSELSSVHAYKKYRNMTWVVSAAFQVTQIMTFAFIGVTSDSLFFCMLLSLLCTYASYFITNFFLKRIAQNRRDPANVLLAGFGIWMYGLVLFSRNIRNYHTVSAYLSLALCTVGATVCVKTLLFMENDIHSAVAFSLGKTRDAALDWLQYVGIEYAASVGQMIAMIALVLICFFTANGYPGSLEEAIANFSPLLTVPAFLSVALSVIATLLFPMTGDHIRKLRRFMALREQGESNSALQEELEKVVIKKHLKHYGIKIVMACMRPFYYHKIRGKENVHLKEGVPVVFVCNHGELYGPIVTNLYVPYSFRPWVTYEMTNSKAMAEYIFNNNIRRMKWLPDKLGWWVVYYIVSPVVSWIMRSVECIPVYHDDPAKLRKTFRETLQTMLSGDNILLFPENSATTQNHKYAREGVSDFFPGFTAIGTLYYNKTKECVRFIPVYADQKKRTITFGESCSYDPNGVNEPERICSVLRKEMLKMAGLDGTVQ